MRNKIGTMQRIVAMFIAVTAAGAAFLVWGCPKIAGFFRHRAVAHATKHELSKAISLYTYAICFERRPIEEYEGRGELYFRTGQWDKASSLIRRRSSSSIRMMVITIAYGPRPIWPRAMRRRAIADANTALEAINRNTGGFNKVDILTLRGGAHAMGGAYAQAEADFAEALTVGATDPVASNAAAWFYATCPAAEVRNGKQAVLLATQACGLTGWKAHYAIDTLAAAEAELSEWDEAMKYESQAIAILSGFGNDDRGLKEYKARLAIFQQRKPYRDERRK